MFKSIKFPLGKIFKIYATGQGPRKGRSSYILDIAHFQLLNYSPWFFEKYFFLKFPFNNLNLFGNVFFHHNTQVRIEFSYYFFYGSLIEKCHLWFEIFTQYFNHNRLFKCNFLSILPFAVPEFCLYLLKLEWRYSCPMDTFFHFSAYAFSLNFLLFKELLPLFINFIAFSLLMTQILN